MAEDQSIWSQLHDFRPLSELQPFEDQLFLVATIIPEAHTMIFTVGDGTKGRYDEMFPKY